MNSKKNLRIIYLILYYGLLQFLPATNNRYFKFIRPVRSSIAKKCLDYAGKKVNIEQWANFGTGNGISIGDYSGIGIRCSVRGPLQIGNNVMMGPEVIILTSSHGFERVDIPMIANKSPLQKKVYVGSDVWIGTRAILLHGISIGNENLYCELKENILSITQYRLFHKVYFWGVPFWIS